MNLDSGEIAILTTIGVSLVIMVVFCLADKENDDLGGRY